MDGKSIFERIALVMASVENVPKNGENTFAHYKYASDADIVSTVRKLMAEHGVMMACIHADVQNEVETTKNGGVSNHCRGMFVWRFACGHEEGQFIDVWMPSEASDTGDKAYYKAITGSKKYALLTTFALETGADAEADHIERGRPQQQAQAIRQQPPAPASRPAPAQQAPAPLSKKQYDLVEKLRREYDEMRVAAGNEKSDWEGLKAGYGHTHLNQFTSKEASEVIATIQKAKADWVSGGAEPPAPESDPMREAEEAGL